MIPLDPCGQVMQWLSRTYTVPCRFYKDSSTLTTKVWYWAADDAAPFPGYHVQGSRHYMDRQIPTEEWAFPGELPGEFTFNDGSNPRGSVGKEGCMIGEPEWFAEGIPPGITIDDVPIPECCFPHDVPTFDHSITALGNPTVFQLLAVPDISQIVVLFATFEGSLTVPPTPPPGWNVLYSQALTGHNCWVYCCWRSFPVPDVYPTFCDGGSAFVSILYFCWVNAAAVGAVGSSLNLQTGVTALSANSLSAPGPSDLLFACYSWTGTFSGEIGPAGMTLVDSNELATTVTGLWQQSGIPSGSTGPRVLTIGVAADSISASVLVR